MNKGNLVFQPQRLKKLSGKKNFEKANNNSSIYEYLFFLFTLEKVFYELLIKITIKLY